MAPVRSTKRTSQRSTASSSSGSSIRQTRNQQGSQSQSSQSHGSGTQKQKRYELLRTIFEGSDSSQHEENSGPTRPTNRRQQMNKTGAQSQTHVDRTRRKLSRIVLEDSEEENSDQARNRGTQHRQKRTNKAQTSSESESRTEKSDSELDSEKKSKSSSMKKASVKQGNQPSKITFVHKDKIAAGSDIESCVNRGVLYFWISLSGNTPVKRVEFVKTILPDEKSMYKECVSSIQKHMKHVFGVSLFAYNDQTHQISSDLTTQGFPSFLMTSTIKVMNVIEHVYSDKLIVGMYYRDYEREKAIRAVLFLYLSVIFLRGLDQGIDEQSMWQIMESLQFDAVLEVKQVDFRKFMKTEYIAPFYLTYKERKDEQGALTNTYYYWGPRSDLEYSKWDVFSRVVKMFPGKKPMHFPAQMRYILNSSEKIRALKEMNEDNQDQNDATAVPRPRLEPDSEDTSESETDSEESDV